MYTKILCKATNRIVRILRVSCIHFRWFIYIHSKLCYLDGFSFINKENEHTFVALISKKDKIWLT